MPRGRWMTRKEAYSIPRSKSRLSMAQKSSDDEKSDQEDDSLSGMNRFAILGGMLRGKKDDDDDDNDAAADTKDEAGFFRSISKRLPFRRDTANGYQVDGEKQEKKSNAILRMMGVGRDSDKKDPSKQLALLRKEQELNRKRQVLIAEQKKRDEEKEKEIKLEEKRIAEEIAKAEAARQSELAKQQKERAKLEAEKQKEEERKQKELTKLEAERKRDALRKEKAEIRRQNALAAADAEKEAKQERETPPSAAAKFFSNVWNTTASAFSRGEEEWVPLIKKTRIDPGEYIPVQVQGLDLLVVASRDGKVHCLANSCSHMGTPLETGRLESRPKEDADGKKILSKSVPPKVECEDCIICPLHQTAFSLETGEVRGEWCPHPPVIGPAMGNVKKTSPVATFDIRTKGEYIEVRINSPLS